MNSWTSWKAAENRDRVVFLVLLIDVQLCGHTRHRCRAHEPLFECNVGEHERWRLRWRGWKMRAQENEEQGRTFARSMIIIEACGIA